MKVLVLGGTGFLGTKVSEKFVKKGCEVIACGKKQFIENDFPQTVDILVNCNGNSKKHKSLKFPDLDFSANVKTVFKSLTKIKCKRYIYISSSEVYGQMASNGFCPNEINTIANNSYSIYRSVYGANKYAAENLVASLADDFIILRTCGLIGKNLKKNIVFDLMNNKPIRENPHSRFQWISTDHVSEIILILSSQLAAPQRKVLNIGGKGCVSVEEMARVLNKEIIFKKDIDKPKHFEIDTIKAQSLYKIKTSKEYLSEFLHTK